MTRGDPGMTRADPRMIGQKLLIRKEHSRRPQKVGYQNISFWCPMWIIQEKISAGALEFIRILKYMKALYICLLSLPSFLPAPDRNQWTLRREKDGINVY